MKHTEVFGEVAKRWAMVRKSPWSNLKGPRYIAMMGVFSGCFVECARGVIALALTNIHVLQLSEEEKKPFVEKAEKLKSDFIADHGPITWVVAFCFVVILVDLCKF